MKLHSYYRSSCSYRVRIALELKGLDYETLPVHVRKGEQHSPTQLAVNPQGLVPTLEDGPVQISQSLAILEYLEERYPEPALLPRAPEERARVRQLALAIACEIQPLQNVSVLDRLTDEFGFHESERLRWLRGVIERGLTAVEALLEGNRHTAEFCHGDSPSLADVCLVPQVYNALRFDCDLGPCPNVVRIHANCVAVDAFQRAAPENQPDAK